MTPQNSTVSSYTNLQHLRRKFMSTVARRVRTLHANQSLDFRKMILLMVEQAISAHLENAGAVVRVHVG